MPVEGSTLALATAPHAWFIPLAQWQNLDQDTIDALLGQMTLYEPEFFHDGTEHLGWEAVIPWRTIYNLALPGRSYYPFSASDGSKLYSDMGRAYETLNSASIILSIFDALEPQKLADFHVNSGSLPDLARLLIPGSSCRMSRCQSEPASPGSQPPSRIAIERWKRRALVLLSRRPCPPGGPGSPGPGSLAGRGVPGPVLGQETDARWSPDAPPACAAGGGGIPAGPRRRSSG